MAMPTITAIMAKSDFIEEQVNETATQTAH